MKEQEREPFANSAPLGLRGRNPSVIRERADEGRRVGGDRPGVWSSAMSQPAPRVADFGAVAKTYSVLRSNDEPRRPRFRIDADEAGPFSGFDVGAFAGHRASGWEESRLSGSATLLDPQQAGRRAGPVSDRGSPAALSPSSRL